jgi:hypothetical protein
MAVSIPWFARIAVKMALASLPIPYSFWKKIGSFSHGEMQESDYVFKVFNNHFTNGGLSADLALMASKWAPAIPWARRSLQRRWDFRILAR